MVTHKVTCKVMGPALISVLCSVKQMRVFDSPWSTGHYIIHRKLAPNRRWYSFTYLRRMESRVSLGGKESLTNIQILAGSGSNWVPCGRNAEVLLHQPHSQGQHITIWKERTKAKQHKSAAEMESDIMILRTYVQVLASIQTICSASLLWTSISTPLSFTNHWSLNYILYTANPAF